MVTDLGLNKSLLTELFPQPRNTEEWLQYALSEEQVRQFKEHGYLYKVRLLNERQLDALRAQLAEMVDPEHEGREFFYEYHSNESESVDNVLFHALGAWRVRTAFHDVLWNPAFRMAAYQLLGKGFRLFHDQLFSKPAKHGSVVAWHQDYSYWTWTTPMAHLTCWMGLDAADTENGCMYYVPDSHHWGLQKWGHIAQAQDAPLSDREDLDLSGQIDVGLKAGSAVLFHSLMVHGSGPNQTEHSRNAALYAYFSPHVRYVPGEGAPREKSFPVIAGLNDDTEHTLVAS